MDVELFDILSFISSYLILLPCLVALFRWKVASLLQKRIVWLVLLVTLVELLSNICWYNLINNHPLYHVYSVCEFWLVLNIYRTSMKWMANAVVIFAGGLFTLFAIVNSVFLQDITEFNSNVTTVSALLIILLSFVSFFQLLTKSTHSSVFSEPQFYINSGFLIYFSSNLILFFISSRVELSPEEGYMIWGAHSIVNCILIIFYTIALWIQPREN